MSLSFTTCSKYKYMIKQPLVHNDTNDVMVLNNYIRYNVPLTNIYLLPFIVVTSKQPLHIQYTGVCFSSFVSDFIGGGVIETIHDTDTFNNYYLCSLFRQQDTMYVPDANLGLFALTTQNETSNNVQVTYYYATKPLVSQNIYSNEWSIIQTYLAPFLYNNSILSGLNKQVFGIIPHYHHHDTHYVLLYCDDEDGKLTKKELPTKIALLSYNKNGLSRVFWFYYFI